MAVIVSMMPSRRRSRAGGKEGNQDKVDEAFLRQQYYDFSSPNLFATRRRLQDAIRRKINKNRDAELDAFLNADRIATQYKVRPKRSFTRRKVETRQLWTEISLDLADFQLLKNRGNNGNGWLLVVVELVSRWVTVRPIKKKDKACMQEAVLSVLNTPPLQKDKVKLAWTDRGLEFECIKHSVFEANSIKLIHTNSEIKATICERKIRDLKSLLFKLCDFAHSLAWTQFIDYVVTRLNNTKLSVLNDRSPLQIVTDPKARAQLKWENAQKMLKFYKSQNMDPKFLPHDKVRILVRKTLFGKGHLAPFSDSLYTVAHVVPSVPLCYRIRNDETGELLKHKFYSQELSLVSTPQIRDIDDLQPKDAQEKKTAEKSPMQRRLEEENKDLYLDGERLAQSRTLRSGRQTAPAQKEYLLKDRKNPRFERYIDQEERDRLIKNGVLSNPPDI